MKMIVKLDKRNRFIVISFVLSLVLIFITFLYFTSLGPKKYDFAGTDLTFTNYIKAKDQREYPNTNQTDQLTIINKDFKNNQDSHIPFISLTQHTNGEYLGLMAWTTKNILDKYEPYKEEYIDKVGVMKTGYRELQTGTDQKYDYITFIVEGVSSTEYVTVTGKVETPNQIYVLRKYETSQSSAKTMEEANEVEQYILETLFFGN